MDNQQYIANMKKNCAKFWEVSFVKLLDIVQKNKMQPAPFLLLKECKICNYWMNFFALFSIIKLLNQIRETFK